jgi:hypothetical protein
MSRKLCEIAHEIRKDWGAANINFAAKPYLAAMGDLQSVNENYFQEGSGRDIVLRFLCNASSWHGENARRIKKELNTMVKG